MFTFEEIKSKFEAAGKEAELLMRYVEAGAEARTAELFLLDIDEQLIERKYLLWYTRKFYAPFAE